MKNLRLHNVEIREFLLKRLGVKQKKKSYIAEKDDFESLRWLYVTFNDLWGHTSYYKKLRNHNVSIHRNFCQNLFINEYARKKKKVKFRIYKGP